MKVTTDALERQPQDNYHKGDGFAGGGTQTLPLSLSFLTVLYLVLCFVMVLVTTCKHEALPVTQLGYTGSPAPPG